MRNNSNNNKIKRLRAEEELYDILGIIAAATITDTDDGCLEMPVVDGYALTYALKQYDPSIWDAVETTAYQMQMERDAARYGLESANPMTVKDALDQDDIAAAERALMDAEIADALAGEW